VARHAVPVDEEHTLTLTCGCRPQLGFAVAAGTRVPLVRHRSWRETHQWAAHARTADETADDSG
jgi:hypothetical protein